MFVDRFRSNMFVAYDYIIHSDFYNTIAMVDVDILT